MNPSCTHRHTGQAVAPLCLAASVVLGLAGAQPAFAGTESQWSAPSGTAVRLLVGGGAPGRPEGGVEIRLAPGWKTYWRYPGDSGIPPRFDWSGSANVANVEILWPAPMRFGDGAGNFSIGYKNDVILPFRLVPQDPSQAMRLSLDLDFAVCEKICQPAHASLALDVPPGGAGEPSPALTAAMEAVPRPAGIGKTGRTTGIESVSLDRSGAVPVLRIEARVEDAARADLFAEGPTDDWALPLPMRSPGADGRAVFALPLEGVPKDADPTSTDLRLTLVDQASAIEVTAPLSELSKR